PVTGAQPGLASDTTLATPASGVLTVSGADITTILNGGSTVRLVFRVKTNRTGADSGGDFNSFGRGAVLLDDVQVQKALGGFSPTGAFEPGGRGGAGATATRFPLPGGLTSTDVWRTSGKPPTEYYHVRNIAELQYNDICGPPNSASRVCNMSGLVLACGNK